MINDLFAKALAIIENPKEDEIKMLRKQCDGVKAFVSAACHRLYDNIRNDKSGNMTVLYVYLNYLQETQEMVSNLRKMLRAIKKMLVIQKWHRASARLCLWETPFKHVVRLAVIG